VSGIPRVVIAGTHSGVGKTTVATALIAAFARRGLVVQPFKIGPDFIDPGFHAAAAGRPCHNLDGWMLSREANLQIFARACEDADLAIIEGVMGLFDGRDGASESASTAEMAKWLGAPVVLVSDAGAMARSAAAVVHGFETFDSALDVAGVVFNRVGGEAHAAMLRDALRGSCRAEPIGFLPQNEKIILPGRHLGLTMAEEVLTGACLDEMADWIASHIDLGAVLQMAGDRSGPLAVTRTAAVSPVKANVRLGVARDAAFCFYYRDNLDLLRASGAEVVEFSPLSDAGLPADVGGLYLGGGYPELHAARLSANRPMMESIRRFADSGGPIYAECGGFMYLTRAIIDLAGEAHPMVGLFPTSARMQPQLAALGYLEAEALAHTLWLRPGERLRGHEFRHSTIDEMPASIQRCLRLNDGRGEREEGYVNGSVLAGYTHLHFASAAQFARRFVGICGAYLSKR
jgi:cobyrinic acid a,c-diamide synthase